jgi:hypothetical protein
MNDKLIRFVRPLWKSLDGDFEIDFGRQIRIWRSIVRIVAESVGRCCSREYSATRNEEDSETKPKFPKDSIKLPFRLQQGQSRQNMNHAEHGRCNTQIALLTRDRPLCKWLRIEMAKVKPIRISLRSLSSCKFADPTWSSVLFKHVKSLNRIIKSCNIFRFDWRP